MRFPAFCRPSAFVVACCLAAGLSSAVSVRAQTLTEVQRLQKAGRYELALKEVDAYLRQHVQDAQGRFYRGVILADLNRTDEAIAVFSRLTEDYPALPEPYNNLAVLYARQFQFERARQMLEKAIRTHPAYAVAYENLGDLYARMASQAYGKALQLDVGNASALGKLALIGDLAATPAPLAPPPVVVAVSPPSAPPSAPPTPPVAAKPPVASPPSQTPVRVATVTPGAASTLPMPEARPAESNAKSPASTGAAPARPEEKASSRPAASASANAGAVEVEKAVLAWAEAWARQDVDRYLAAYARDFQPPRGLSRAAWEAERKSRITKPAWIKVQLRDLDVEIAGERATVQMAQSYQASNFRGDSRKTLILVRVDGRWRILAETVR